MDVVIPLQISDGTSNGKRLSTTAVDETTTHGAWAVGTTYAATNTVTLLHGRYESRIGSNVGNSPVDGTTTTQWLYLGPLNSWAMFDKSVETQTTKSDAFTTVLVPADVVTTLALLNLDASTVDLTGTDGPGGATIYGPKTVNLIQDVGDAWEWCFTPAIMRTDLVLSDLPLYSTLNLSITVNKPGAVAKCGVCVLGTANYIGMADYGTSVSIIDYSSITTDGFGRRVVTIRGYAKKMNVPLTIDSVAVDAMIHMLAQYRGQLLVWVGTDMYQATIIYGFYKNLESIYTDWQSSRCNLEVEGIV